MTDTQPGPLVRWLRDDYFEEYLPDRVEGTNLMRKARTYDALLAEMAEALRELVPADSTANTYAKARAALARYEQEER